MMGLATVSQPIGNITNLATRVSSSSAGWFVNGVRWVGLIKTLGPSGCDYATMAAAIVATYGQDVLLLVYPGDYDPIYFPTPAYDTTRTVVVKGVGGDPTVIRICEGLTSAIEFYSGKTFLAEGVTFYGANTYNGVVFRDSCLEDMVSVSFNKCYLDFPNISGYGLFFVQNISDDSQPAFPIKLSQCQSTCPGYLIFGHAGQAFYRLFKLLASEVWRSILPSVATRYCELPWSLIFNYITSKVVPEYDYGYENGDDWVINGGPGVVTVSQKIGVATNIRRNFSNVPGQ
jgi:hypothetical protein